MAAVNVGRLSADRAEMVTNGANVAAKVVAVRAPRAVDGEARGFLSWFVPIVIAVGATAAAIARGLPQSHELWAVGVLLALSLLVGAQPYRLSASVRFPVLGSLLIVTAGMLGGPAGAAVVGWTIGLAGLRRSALPRGLAEAAGCALGGSLAGLAAWRVLQGVEGLPPLVVIGASLCGASVLGLSRLAVDQLFWRGGGSRSSETAVVYRLAVAGDVLLAGLFASALVGIVHVWGTLAPRRHDDPRCCEPRWLSLVSRAPKSFRGRSRSIVVGGRRASAAGWAHGCGEPPAAR